MKIRCPRCNSIIDTEDDPTHIGNEPDFAFCRNPDCLWVTNLKYDEYALVKEPSSKNQSLVANQVNPEKDSQSNTKDKERVLDAFRTLRQIPSPPSAKHASELIPLYERLLPLLDDIHPNSPEYALLKQEIGSVEGNYYDMPERYFADFHFNLACLYKGERKYEDSISHFKKAIQYIPLLPHLYCYLSETLLRVQKFDEAITLWEDAIKLPFSKDDLQDVIKPHYKETLEFIKEKRAQLAFAKKKILPVINSRPGILQTELYSLLEDEEYDISSILYELALQGIIRREKRGKTYALFPPFSTETSPTKCPSKGLVFPDRTAGIEFHKSNAYMFLKEKNYDLARTSFFKWVESVRQQNINTGGKLEKELQEAKRAYSEFAEIDPTYIRLCDIILPIIKENPGVLQTELYKMLPQIEREALSYALYFAAEHGKIKRTKKGRTYSLTI